MVAKKKWYEKVEMKSKQVLKHQSIAFENKKDLVKINRSQLFDLSFNTGKEQFKLNLRLLRGFVNKQQRSTKIKYTMPPIFA